MFAYQGSKAKELNQIAAHQPTAFKTFIDVFGGGGSVFLHYLAMPGVHAVYNDIQPDLCEIVQAIAGGSETAAELAQNAGQLLPKTQAERNQLLADHIAQPTGARLLALNKSAMRGMTYRNLLSMRKINGINTLEVRNIGKLDKYSSLFIDGKFSIYNADYRAILAKYQDDPDAFLYCDPPYISRTCDNGAYGKVADNYIETLDAFMRNPATKCRVMLHIDFTGSNYHHFKDLYKISYPVNYNARTIAAKTRKNETYHMIATNY